MRYAVATLVAAALAVGLYAAGLRTWQAVPLGAAVLVAIVYTRRRSR